MGEGWIKLYRKLLHNEELFRAGSTFPVFCLLLLMADRDGKLTAGRNQLARKLKMKPSTVYSALKRLESSTAIRQLPNTKMTTIYICNWDKYQHKDDTSSTQAQHTIRKKDINTLSKDKVSQVPVGTVTSVYEFYLEKFNASTRYRLSDSRKAKLKARLRDAGEEMLIRAITNTAKSSFHRGDNDRGWQADLDYIIRTYENVEKLANMDSGQDMPSLEDALNAI